MSRHPLNSEQWYYIVCLKESLCIWWLHFFERPNGKICLGYFLSFFLIPHSILIHILFKNSLYICGYVFSGKCTNVYSLSYLIYISLASKNFSFNTSQISTLNLLVYKACAMVYPKIASFLKSYHMHWI